MGNDEESLARDVAEGRLSLRQIARKHNVAPMLVCDIRQGRKRPDLTARIDSLRELLLFESERLVTPWLKRLLLKEAQVGITGTDETARVCRHYFLDRFLPHDGSDCPWLRKRSRRRRNSRRTRI